MGRKINPISFRLGINFAGKVRGYIAQKNYLTESIMHIDVYNYVIKFFTRSVVSDVIIERAPEKISLSLVSPKPGIIIARKGAMLEELKKKLTEKFSIEFSISIIEVRKSELDVNYVADDIAKQIQKRASFKRVMNKAVMMAMKSGAYGVKIQLSGRLNGAEIARTEKIQKGALPAHTIKADINYAKAEAFTSYGVIGVKVWINLGIITSYDPYKYDRRLSMIVNKKGGRRAVS